MSAIFAGDESGNLSFGFSEGGTSYFVFALVEFKNPDETRQQSENFRQQRGLRSKEFSFHGIKSERLKERVVQFLATLPITAWVLVVKKQEIAEPYLLLPKNTLYALLLSEAIRQIPLSLRDGRNLIMDEYDRSGKIFQELVRLGKTRGVERGFKKIVGKRSSSEPLIQIADLIAGSVYSRYVKADHRYFGTIQEKLVVAEFPSKEKPPS